MVAILEIWADDSEENQENVPPRGKHTKPRVVKDRTDPLTLIAPDQAKRKYKLWPEVLYKLCDELASFLERKTALPVIHQVLAALRFYTYGTYLEVTGDTLNLSKSSECICVHKVSRLLSSPNMLAKYLMWPHLRDLPSIKEAFFRRGLTARCSGIPNITGCVNGESILC